MLHVAAGGTMNAQHNLSASEQDAPVNQQLSRQYPPAGGGTPRNHDDAWAPQVIGYTQSVAGDESQGSLGYSFQATAPKDIPLPSKGYFYDSADSLDSGDFYPSGSEASSPTSRSPEGSPTEGEKDYKFSGYFAKRFLSGSQGEHNDVSKRRHFIETSDPLSETYRSYDDISEEAISSVGECRPCNEHISTTCNEPPTINNEHNQRRDLCDPKDLLLDAGYAHDQDNEDAQTGRPAGLKLYIPWNMDAFDSPLQEGANNIHQGELLKLYSSKRGCISEERALHEQVGLGSSSSRSRTTSSLSSSSSSSSGVSSVWLPGVPAPPLRPPSPTITQGRHVAHDQDVSATQSTSAAAGVLIEELEEEDLPDEDINEAWASRLQQARSSVDYQFETWEEPYFDPRTGERILSTIYEFELSASEESDEDEDLYFRKGGRRASILVAPYDIWSVMESQDVENAEGEENQYCTANVTVVGSENTANNFEKEIISSEGVTVLTIDGNMSEVKEISDSRGIMEHINSSDIENSINDRSGFVIAASEVNDHMSDNPSAETSGQSGITNENECRESIDVISHMEYEDKIKLINEAPESAIEKIVSIMEGNDDIYSVIDDIVEIVIKENNISAEGKDLADTPSPAPTEQEALEDNARTREEDRIQKDRCLEVYPETLRQRQRAMIQANNKVDIKNWSSSGGDLQQTSNKSNKKFLPSVKALRNQFESGKGNHADVPQSPTNNLSSAPVLSRRSSSSTSSLASSSLEKASSTNSLNSQGGSTDNLLGPSIENGSSPRENGNQQYEDEPVEPIFNQFKQVDEELRELMKRPPTTTGWNPRPLLRRLYYVPDAPKIQSRGTTYVNIEGYLEKLPSGRKKATFWNAWKRRYFVAKDGVLYYYQNNQSEKPSMKMSLMGGKVECMEPSMIGVDDGRGDKSGVMLGIDDGKGHYVVVRCSSRQEAERWRRALETHNVEDFASQYVQPWPIPTNPTLLRDTLVVDLGSASVRAGVLASNPTLPQLFFPSVVSTERGGSRQQIWGFDSLSPDIRAKSSITFPLRPSHKISKYSVDLSTVSSLLQKTFAELNVDPKNYHLQISVPRVLNTNTQAELLRILFEKFDVKSVNLTHQSILALYAYNATSGIVVDIGERMDIVPVIDGYIVDGGVSRVPYGGHRILDHLRQFLYQNNVSLVNEVESYLIRYILENACYCAHHYNTEKARCTNNSDNFEKNVSLSEFFQGQPCPYTNVNVDFGRFQATEGLFNPDAWGLDHPGLHKLVHKAIQECSMDIRKEMSRSIFLAGGVSQLPGLTDRLTTELDNLTPPAIRPKVHASPYCYHAAYLGGCVLAESPAFVQSRITRQDWNNHGNMALRKWSL